MSIWVNNPFDLIREFTRKRLMSRSGDVSRPICFARIRVWSSKCFLNSFFDQDSPVTHVVGGSCHHLHIFQRDIKRTSVVLAGLEIATQDSVDCFRIEIKINGNYVSTFYKATFNQENYLPRIPVILDLLLILVCTPRQFQPESPSNSWME